MKKANEIIERFQNAQNRLVLQASDLSLGSIGTMVEREAIDIRPSFQRRERWTRTQQSALIESFLLNVPVPPVYLSEDEFGKYSVVDGKQRITSIHLFMFGHFKLTGLERFQEIEGLRIGDLPDDLRNALEVRPYLRVVTLLKQTDPLLKYEVFTRLNRGGEPMEPQELRNVAFRGPLNDLIYELAGNSFLRKQLKIKSDSSSAFKLMADAEYVLRFFTLEKNWEKFSGKFRLEMDNFMRINQHAENSTLATYRSKFERSINAVETIWGSNAFKRPTGDGWRDQCLAGMYDAQMVAVAKSDNPTLSIVSERSNQVLKETRKLFQDKEFETAVRQGTNTPARILYRIKQLQKLLNDIAAA